MKQNIDLILDEVSQSSFSIKNDWQQRFNAFTNKCKQYDGLHIKINSDLS